MATEFPTTADIKEFRERLHEMSPEEVGAGILAFFGDEYVLERYLCDKFGEEYGEDLATEVIEYAEFV